jgi:hypothetical protein
MLETACAKPYNQRNKNQNTRKPRVMRPEQGQCHKWDGIDRDSRRQKLLTGESGRNLRQHEQMPNNDHGMPEHC